MADEKEKIVDLKSVGLLKRGGNWGASAGKGLLPSMQKPPKPPEPPPRTPPESAGRSAWDHVRFALDGLAGWETAAIILDHLCLIDNAYLETAMLLRRYMAQAEANLVIALRHHSVGNDGQ